MYEHHKQPLASRKTFARRLTLNVLIAAGILFISLGIGVLGYHQIRGMETPAFTHGEEMPPPSFGLVSIFTLTPFSKW
jgi:hypothetical protein